MCQNTPPPSSSCTSHPFPPTPSHHHSTTYPWWGAARRRGGLALDGTGMVPPAWPPPDVCLPPPPLFEASLIPPFKIKSVKKRMSCNEATEGDISRAPLERCQELRLCWPTMHHLRRRIKCSPSPPNNHHHWELPVGFAWIGKKKTLWSHRCKWKPEGFFLFQS